MTIGPRTRVGAVIGWPVEHSLSPALHNAAFAAAGLDAVFVALPVAPDDAEVAIRGMAAMGFLGASVTVPHKRAAHAAADELAETAQAVGAVNCLTFADGRIIGHNTDAGGFTDALTEAFPALALAGLRPVLLGGGGAARAVAAGLEQCGTAAPVVVVRSPDRVHWTAARPWTAATLSELLPGCNLLVDCTSTALSAQREAALPAPIPLDRLPDDAIVGGLVYHRRPALLSAATERGLRTIDGAGMLVHQGARAFHLWTGSEPPIAAMWRALRRAVAET